MLYKNRKFGSHQEVSSIVQPDVYELVWRLFKRTSIHEALLEIWTSDLKAWEDSVKKGRSLFPTAKLTTWQGLIIDPVFADRPNYNPPHLESSPHYHAPEKNRFIEHGFPLPKQGGILRRSDDKSRLRIYMDDLFLCPECGQFQPFQDNWPDISWLDYEEKRTDVEAMFESIEQRRHSKEFSFRPCEDREYCQQTVTIFRARFDRENEWERERLTWAAKVKEIEQRYPIPQKPVVEIIESVVGADRQPNRFVYLVGGDGYVKIGVATNVKKRFSSLQTASPISLKLLKSWQCADAYAQEFRLHQKYKSFREKGEWFRLSEPVLKDLLTIDDLDNLFES